MTTPTGGHVPLYAGERIVGRAIETEDGWTAQLCDGTRLGSHRTLTEARAAILARVCRPIEAGPAGGRVESLPAGGSIG